MDQTVEADLEAMAENEQVFGFLLVVHGAVHVVGTLACWRLAEVNRVRYDDVWPAAGTVPAWIVGAVWLAAGLWLAVIGARLANRRAVDRRHLAGAALLSAGVTLTAWPAALPGMLISGAIVIAVGFLAKQRATRRRRS